MYDYYNQPILAYVNGIEGAKAFQMMPNRNAILMDNERDVFYFKTCNPMGQFSIKSYRFEEIHETPKSEYASIDQLNEIKAMLEKMLHKDGDVDA